MIPILADLHVHTLTTPGAVSTWLDNLEEAKKRGLKAIAITDKIASKGNENALIIPHENPDIVPAEYEGIRIYYGYEGDIQGVTSKDIDIGHDFLYNMDLVIAAYHPLSIYDLQPTYENITSLYLDIANNPAVMVIGHPDRYGRIFDCYRVIETMKGAGKVMEINNKSLLFSQENRDRAVAIAKACKELGAPVSVGSDAYFPCQVGRFDAVQELFEYVDFPEELVINSDMDFLEEYIQRFRTYKLKRFMSTPEYAENVDGIPFVNRRKT